MPTTRSKSQEETAPTCHVLDYSFADKGDDGFTMTALVHTLRFHISVDTEDLKAKSVQEEYLGLLNAVRGKEQPQGTKRKRGDDAVSTADSGYASPQKRSASTSSSSVTLADDDREDPDGPVRELQNWVLAPFGDVFADRAPPELDDVPKTVAEWFHNDVFFYRLTTNSSDELEPKERSEPSKELRDHVESLAPSLKMPKYLLSPSVPIFGTSDLQIVATSDSPSPRHPAVVKSTKHDSMHFLKLVDPTQPGPVKRELKILRDIETKGLHKKMRVPLVQGLVVDDHSHPDKHDEKTSRDRPLTILGFLLTPIPDPTPLTEALDKDSSEPHRETWAKTVEKYVALLHEHGIIWGDAKADNFMVDREDKLWIIDFGGSYTEGWIEPELAETIEGDDAGVQKVKNAVLDPENFTFDPEEEKEGEEEEGPATKVAKLQHEDDEE